MKGSDQKNPVGNKLNRGSMVSVGRQLIMYAPRVDGRFERRIELVWENNLGEYTPPIVALFKDRESALQCMEAEDLKPCDPRWAEKTKEVISEIGNDHPHFYLCQDHDIALNLA